MTAMDAKLDTISAGAIHLVAELQVSPNTRQRVCTQASCPCDTGSCFGWYLANLPTVVFQKLTAGAMISRIVEERNC